VSSKDSEHFWLIIGLSVGFGVLLIIIIIAIIVGITVICRRRRNQPTDVNAFYTGEGSDYQPGSQYLPPNDSLGYAMPPPETDKSVNEFVCAPTKNDDTPYYITLEK